jgi:hypothetical protein
VLETGKHWLPLHLHSERERGRFSRSNFFETCSTPCRRRAATEAHIYFQQRYSIREGSGSAGFVNQVADLADFDWHENSVIPA